jgi:predicted secreted hydrolase
VFGQTNPPAGYELALPGYHYRFPRDHFNHPAYQTEWWYYTGNIKANDGRRFGFELTFFRQAISRDHDTSVWHMDDLYMAHLALSDLRGHRFYHDERINRAGPGLAGVDENAALIWNGNWQVKIGAGDQSLNATDDQFAIQFDLKPAKPPVIHGRDGISQKASGAGHASHYISFTRLLTSGNIELNGVTYQVQGTTWMDHEFFSASMDSTESGWDWLSLQLEDNTELMLYRLRHKDGSVDPYSSGSYIDAQGRCHNLSAGDFSMIPAGDLWTSPRTSAAYPTRWHVGVPSLGLQLEITTQLRDQELEETVGPSYWEGAIDIAGQRGGNPMHGVGYLEMTGYAPNSPSQF